MTDDPMHTLKALYAQFEEVNERFETPAGWWISTIPGWTHDLFGASRVADDEFMARLTRGEEMIEWSGYKYPGAFTMAIAEVQDKSDPESPLAGSHTRLFLRLSSDHEVRIVGGLAAGGEIDDRLSALYRLRPRDWWKTKALLDLRLEQLAGMDEQAIRELELGREELFVKFFRSVIGPTRTSQQRRNNKITPSLLRQVAETYRSALAAGNPPTEAVRARFHLTRPNASKWVARARRDGFLGAAVGPVAGERPIDE